MMMQFLIRSVLEYVKYHDFCNLDVYASTCNIEISPLVLPQENFGVSLLQHGACRMSYGSKLYIYHPPFQ